MYHADPGRAIDRESKATRFGRQRPRDRTIGIIEGQQRREAMVRSTPSDERERADAIRAEAEEFGAKFSDYNLIAAYEDMGAAKKAVDALQLAGIEAADYSLLGETLAHSEARVDQASVHEGDAGLTNDWLRRAVLWGVAGGILGLIVGAIVAAIPDTPLNLAYWLIIGGITGLTLGGFIGVMYRIDAGPNADAAYRPMSNRHVLLGVISQDQKRVARAESVLTRGHPLALHRYDRRGQLQT
jgi:hypothetical protein